MKLTDLSIKSLAVPTGRRTFLDDAIKGFGIRVSPRSKTFVLIVHRGNRNEWENIGKYPIVSLGAAREAARNRLAAIQLKQEHQAPTLTFAEAFDLFKQTHTSKKNRERTAKETERLIAKHFLPRLRHRDIADIDQRLARIRAPLVSERIETRVQDYMIPMFRRYCEDHLEAAAYQKRAATRTGEIPEKHITIDVTP